MVQKLKQQTTSSCFARYFEENRQKLLNSFFKIDLSLKNLNDELLSAIFNLVLTKIKTLSIRRYMFIQLIPLKLPNALKGNCFFVRWYHFTAIFLISLLHSHLLCKHDVPTLLAPYQLLQIFIYSPILLQCFAGFRRSKHTFV